MSRPGRIKPITGINQAIPTPTMDMSLAKMQGGSAGYVAEAADVTGGAAAAGGAGISPAMYMEAGNAIGGAVKSAAGHTQGGSIAGTAIQGAGTGAMIGSIVPGVGTAVGAAVGGAIGAGVGAIQHSKAEKERVKAEAAQEAQALVDRTIPGVIQSNIYKKGTSGISKSKHIEVERDEIVLRKSGKAYSMVADFRGGKNHSQGGESYKASEGDVIFPAKDRDEILGHINTGNYNGIENMRKKLPKDAPIAKNGSDNTIEEISVTSKKPKGLKGIFDPIPNQDYFELGDNAHYANAVSRMPDPAFDRAGFPQYGVAPTGLFHDPNFKSEPVPNTPSPFGDPNDFDRAGFPKYDIAPKGLFYDPNFKEPTTPSPFGDGFARDIPLSPNTEERFKAEGMTGQQKQGNKLVNTFVNPKVNIDPLSAIGDGRITNIDLPGLQSSNYATPAEPETVEPETAMNKVSAFARGALANIKGAAGNLDLDGVGKEVFDYLPAVSNLIQGFQKPKTVDRRFVTPDSLRYRDESAGLRRTADDIYGAEAEAAEQYGAGSSANIRAGKIAAGVRKFDRYRGIEGAESSRALQFANANTERRNQAEATNIQLANKYDEADSQNAAAVDAYRQQGTTDLFRINKQKAMDKRLADRDQMLLNAIESQNYIIDPATGKVTIKKQK